MNAYRWHPPNTRFDPRREPHVVLSDAFEVFELDLQARLRAEGGSRTRGRTLGERRRERRREAPNGRNLRPALDSSARARAENGAASWDEDFRVSVPVAKDGAWNAVVFWFEADMGHSGDVLRSAEPPPPISQQSNVVVAKRVHGVSLGLAAQYLDEVFVRVARARPCFCASAATTTRCSSRPRLRP